MDSGLPNVDHTDFQLKKDDFKECYRDAEEMMPHQMPSAQGKSVVTTACVDASFASDKVTRSSHTGFMIFVNRPPVKWCSMKQLTIESTAFLAEHIKLKTCVEEFEFRWSRTVRMWNQFHLRSTVLLPCNFIRWQAAAGVQLRGRKVRKIWLMLLPRDWLR